MKKITLLVGGLALVAWATVSIVNGQGPVTAPGPNPYAVETLPPIPATPAAVDGIVYARKFTLAEGYSFRWCAEQPTVKSGYLLVLKVNPDLVYPRQAMQPVLYVGNQVAERINHGYPSGHVVAIVPGDTDLSKDLMWFGAPDLPERVNAMKVRSELKRAEAAGIKPLSLETLTAAREKGNEELKGANIVDVLRVAADLIRQYSPQEKELADTCVPAPAPTPAPDADPN